MIYFGIDPGENTGVAVWNKGLVCAYEFNIYDRLAVKHFYSKIKPFIKKGGHLFIEATGFNKRILGKTPTYHAGAAVFLLGMEKFPIKFLLPSQWHKSIYGEAGLTRKVAKEAAVAYVLTRHGYPCSENAAEAACIVEAGVLDYVE